MLSEFNLPKLSKSLLSSFWLQEKQGHNFEIDEYPFTCICSICPADKLNANQSLSPGVSRVAIKDSPVLIFPLVLESWL